MTNPVQSHHDKSSAKYTIESLPQGALQQDLQMQLNKTLKPNARIKSRQGLPQQNIKKVHKTKDYFLSPLSAQQGTVKFHCNMTLAKSAKTFP